MIAEAVVIPMIVQIVAGLAVELFNRRNGKVPFKDNVIGIAKRAQKALAGQPDAAPFKQGFGEATALMRAGTDPVTAVNTQPEAKRGRIFSFLGAKAAPAPQ